jgi:DNA-directed RNA polymerase specialized sigma subunit
MNTWEPLIMGVTKPQSPEELQAKQKKEMQLWHTWNSNGRAPEHMSPMLKSLRPLIQHEVNAYRRIEEIPTASKEAEFTKWAIHGMMTFDPDRGVLLSTHVRNNMKKGLRYIANYQNPARIPEKRAAKVGEYKAAMDILDERLGRPPSNAELSEHLGWHPTEVALFESEVIKAKPLSHSIVDPVTNMPSKAREAIGLAFYEMSPEEKAVAELTFGMNGKKTMQPGEVARHLKMSPSKVSRLRKSIGVKVGEYDLG